MSLRVIYQFFDGEYREIGEFYGFPSLYQEADGRILMFISKDFCGFGNVYSLDLTGDLIRFTFAGSSDYFYDGNLGDYFFQLSPTINGRTGVLRIVDRLWEMQDDIGGSTWWMQ